MKFNSLFSAREYAGVQRLFGCVSPSKSLSVGSDIRENVCCCVCGCVLAIECVCARARVCARGSKKEREGMKVRFCSETFDVEEQCLLSVCQLPALYHHLNTWPSQSVRACLGDLITQALGYVTLLQGYLV